MLLCTGCLVHHQKPHVKSLLPLSTLYSVLLHCTSLSLSSTVGPREPTSTFRHSPPPHHSPSPHPPMLHDFQPLRPSHLHPAHLPDERDILPSRGEPPRRVSPLFPLSAESVEDDWSVDAAKHHHPRELVHEPAREFLAKRHPLLDTPARVVRPEIVTVSSEKVLDPPGRHDRPSHVSALANVCTTRV